MAPYEALYRRPCRSSVCWTEVGERPTMGPDFVRDGRFDTKASSYCLGSVEELR